MSCREDHDALPPDERGMDGARSAMEVELRDRVRRDERKYGSELPAADSLWDHLLRVASIAERLGSSEGLDPALCRMAGLFHDAGKFAGGKYHDDDCPEEERSAALLRELASTHGVGPEMVEPVAEAFTQIYRDAPQSSALAGVLFDADNLDKLGPLGVANFFTKLGQRGGGISRQALFRITVELTYAHHAGASFLTASGRALAVKRAAQSKAYFTELLEALRADGLHDFRIEEVDFEGLRLQVVAPAACCCGGELQRQIWSETGIKCTEVHLEHRCVRCRASNCLRFCRPRLASGGG